MSCIVPAPSRRGEKRGGKLKTDHQLRDHRGDPRPGADPAPADHAGADRRAGDRRRRRRRRDPPPPRPRPGDRQADRRPRRLRRVPPPDQGGHRRGDQHHHRGQRDDEPGRTRRRRDPLPARALLDEHGLDELRDLPDRQRGERVAERLGRALPGVLERLDLPQHLHRRRRAGRAAGAERHPLRVRVLRHRPPLQPRPLPRTGDRRTAPLRAERDGDPRRDRHPPRGPAPYEEDRRPPLRRPVPLVGARRRPPPGAADHAGGVDGIGGRAGRPRGLDPPARAASSPSRTRPRSSARCGSSTSSRWSRRPRTRRARSSASRAPDKTSIPDPA